MDRIHEAIEWDANARRASEKTAEIAALIDSLTTREREVMEMIVDGKASKVMAAELNISEKTVQTHRARVMEKMNAKSVADLVRMVLKVEAAQSGHPP